MKKNSSILLGFDSSYGLHAFYLQNFCTDSKGYLVDEEGFDYMKISFLREIKAQNRSLRYVFLAVCFISVCEIAIWTYSYLQVSLILHVAFAEIIQRLMLDLSIMMKRNLGLKGVMLHFLVLHRMKLISLTPLVWLIQVVVY